MEQINNPNDFLRWLKEPGKDYLESKHRNTFYRPKKGLLVLGGLDILNIEISAKRFESTEFRNCKFENCDFTSSFFSSCSFENCLFQDCEFTWSKFLDVDLSKCQFESCTICDFEMADAEMKDVLFINCGEILDLSIRGMRERKISFINCYIHHLDIEPTRKMFEQIEFIDCLIKESSFDRVDFKGGLFQDCSLSLNQFSACELSTETFKGKNEAPGKEYNLIDIRTILNSEPIQGHNLEELFGIHNLDVKD